jgi:hypothetical protein
MFGFGLEERRAGSPGAKRALKINAAETATRPFRLAGRMLRAESLKHYILPLRLCHTRYLSA